MTANITANKSAARTTKATAKKTSKKTAARTARKTALLLLCLLLLFASGCSTAKDSGSTLDDYPAFVEVPLIRQGTLYTCGIACLHSILRWVSYDLDINDQYLMEECGTSEENGTSGAMLMQYLQGIEQLDVAWQEEMPAEQLKEVIDRHGVVLISIQAWENKEVAADQWEAFTAEDYRDYWNGGHWVIACGYNEKYVLFMDPSTAGCYTQMTWDDLELRWHDTPDDVTKTQNFKKYDHLGIVIYKLNEEVYDRNAVQPLL